MSTQEMLYLNRLSEKIHSILIRTNVFHVFLVELFVFCRHQCALCSLPRNKTVTPRQDPEIWSADQAYYKYYK